MQATNPCCQTFVYNCCNWQEAAHHGILRAWMHINNTKSAGTGRRQLLSLTSNLGGAITFLHGFQLVMQNPGCRLPVRSARIQSTQDPKHALCWHVRGRSLYMWSRTCYEQWRVEAGLLEPTLNTDSESVAPCSVSPVN